MPPKLVGRRAIFLLSFTGAAFLTVGVRFWDLQVVHGAHYQALAQQDQLRQIPIPAPRGNIVTSDGVVVAGSKPAWSLYYLSQGGPLPTAEVSRLASYLGEPASNISKSINAQLKTQPSYDPVAIDANLTPKQMTVIEENINHLPYLRIQPTAIRNYPYGSVMGNVLGFLDLNTATADKGASGLEMQYNKYLVGQSGGEYAEVNRQGQLVKLFGQAVPTPGDTLHLTINWQLEKTAYEALAYDMKTIQNAPAFTGARSPGANQGGVIAINPNNGDVLAIASLPSYNPNLLLPNSTTRNSYIAQLTKDPHFSSLYEFIPIQQLFSPGSIFKPIMATAALAAGILTPTRQIFDPGYFPKDPAFHNWYAPGFGWLDVKQALGLSDDVFFYTVGYDMGINLIDQWLNKFLLNKLTGIDLPGEVQSIPPTPQQLQKDGDGAWTWGWNLNTAIGQGIDQFTMVALARADSAIANGGTLYKPHLVSEITTANGKVVKKFNPVVQGKLNVAQSVFSVVHQGMILSAQDPNIKDGVSGTGYGALAGFPVSVASKTGTAQVYGKPNNAFFLTYGPMPHPKILIIVYVKSGLWGAHSGFVARAIYDQYFKVKDPKAKALFDSTFGGSYPWPFGYKPPAPKAP